MPAPPDPTPEPEAQEGGVRLNQAEEGGVRLFEGGQMTNFGTVDGEGNNILRLGPGPGPGPGLF
ncbi:hypothetical protein TWF718_004160 [Orbilia javanica]|uniref:Uncharacterized protein n=1 Tax=Orbilia javanica TaxID=47235 RepID=A0AAN8RQ39_9PEZI